MKRAMEGKSAAGQGGISIRGIVAIALALACALPGLAGRNQVWFKGELEGTPIKEGWAKDLLFKSEEELKYNMGHDARIFDEEFLVMLGWRWCPYVSTLAGWRYVDEQSTSTLRGRLHNESRPTIQLELKAPEFWTLKLDARTRVEFRNKHGQQEYERYRERLRLRTSWSVTEFQISPYVSEEFFFEDKPHHIKDDTFDRSRSQVGFYFKPMPASLPNLTCNAYYMVQHDLFRHDQWTPTNVYGLEFKYTF